MQPFCNENSDSLPFQGTGNSVPDFKLHTVRTISLSVLVALAMSVAVTGINSTGKNIVTSASVKYSQSLSTVSGNRESEIGIAMILVFRS
ncbi:hypothetical protein HNY73_014322 [Argiope bruennichi]|uniref:Uncharacterized protein n=1 Tax=Argiope bruennichi TaxID=94029 RepID=A0A8T0ESX9_ARGBR|nr:hypothetical protein HNY73_014322 [Argiope bruennichi]